MGRTILLTGATGAIGEATAKSLAKADDLHIILAGRNMRDLEKLKTGLLAINPRNSVEIITVDLGSLASVNAAIESIKCTYQHMETIVNLAAVYMRNKTTTVDKLETMFATNYVGVFLFTNSLVAHYSSINPLKIITVASSSISKIDFQNLNGERKFSSIANFSQSKACLILYAKKLARTFNGSGSVSIGFDPGIVQSRAMDKMPLLIRIIGKMIGSTPHQSAQTLTQLILEPDCTAYQGKFINKKGITISMNRYSDDTLIQDKLWEMTKLITQ